MQPSQLKAALAVQAPASGGTAQPQGDNTDEARLSAVMLHRKSCIIVADAGSADVDPLLGSARLPQEVPFLVRLACASTLHSVSALLVDGEHVVDLVLCHQAQQCGVQSAAAAANLARFHYSTWKHAAAQQPVTNMEQALAFISAAQRITSSLQQPACQQHTVLQLHTQGSGDAKSCQRTITVLGVSGCSAASVCSRVAQLMLMPMAGGAPPTLTRPAGVAAPAWAILAPYIRACTVVMTLPDAGTTVLGGPHSHPVTEAPPEDVEPPVLHEEQALLRELVQQQQELVQAQAARITTLEQDRANLQEQMVQLKAQLLASPGDVPLALTSSASLAPDDASTGSGHGSHNIGSNVITSVGSGNGSNVDASTSSVNASTSSGTGLITASSTPNTWRPTDFLRSMTLTSLNGSSDARSLPLTSPCGTKPLGPAELPMPPSRSWFGQEPDVAARAAQQSLTSPGAPGLVAPAAQRSKASDADTLQPSRSVPAEKPSSRAAPLKASQSLGKRPPRPAGPLKASHSLGESGSIARSLQALLPGPSLRRANTSVASSAASSAAADMAAASSTLVSSASLPVGTQPGGDLAEQLRVCRLELAATKQQVELLASKLTQKVERSPGVDIKLMQEVAALREECAAGSAQLAAARAQVLALNAQVHEQAALIAKLQAHSSRDSSPSTPSSSRQRGSPRSQGSSAPSSPSLPSSSGRGRAPSHSSSRGSDTGGSSSSSSGGARHGQGSRQSPHGSFTSPGQRACGASIKSWPLHVVTYRLAADAAVRAAAQTLWARSASHCRAKPIASFPLRDTTISSFRLHDNIISAAEEEPAAKGDSAQGPAPAAGSTVAELAQAMPPFAIVWEATPAAAAVAGTAAVSTRSGAATNVQAARLGSQPSASLQSADSMYSTASVLSGTSSASLSTVRSGSVSSTSSHARSSGRRSTSLPAGLPPACSLRLGSKPLSLPLGSHPLQATPRAGATAGSHVAAQAEQGLPGVHAVRCTGPRTVRTFALRLPDGLQLSSDEPGSEPDSGASERDVSDEACDMDLQQRSPLKRPRLTCG